MSAHTAAPVSRQEIVAAIQRPVSRTPARASLALAAIGLVVFIAGLFLAPERAWRALHFNWLFFTATSSAGVMFAAAQRITTARWSRPVIRFCEAYVAFLPVALIILALDVLVGHGRVFPFLKETPAVHEKAIWLAPGLFTGRVLGVFFVMTLLSIWFVWTSVRLDVAVTPEWGTGWARGMRERMRRGFGDERRELHSTHSRQGKLAVILAIVWGFGWCFLAFDLSMSLDIHFQSTLYGWWFFMGGMLCATTSLALLARWWRNQLNVPHLITEITLHDIGKLAFAFTAFWGYLTFGQYLVIWYGNLAEETHFMRQRLISPWLPVTVTMVLLVFAFPFFGLMGRKPKIVAPWIIIFSVGSLIGVWMLRYLEVYPSLYSEALAVPFGFWELAIGLGMLGLWGICYFAFLDAFPRMRVFMMTSAYRDEVQVPVNARTMEPLPAHE
ncbi:MAG TPA: hypothetical protein VNB89_05220 [Gemmatimonadaceae bacterium]|jgi:hypothetical protein|nr:hypothetical protein [Gemmatimonadaceae bacterium]